MVRDFYKKSIVFAILVVLIGAVAIPSISGIPNIIKDDKENPVITLEAANSATISLHTFDETVENQCDAVILEDAAFEIHDILGELRYKITFEPRSDETKELKIRFANLLDKYGLIPEGLSKDYVLSLLNPSWFYGDQEVPGEESSSPLFSGSTSPLGGLGFRLQEFLKVRFRQTAGNGFDEGILSLLPKDATGTAIFCSISSAGNGVILPLFLLPRPRVGAMWLSPGGVTLVGELSTVKGFTAYGAQVGLALGFIGLGLTYSLPGYTLYGFIGYALFTSVSADEIEFFPPNQPPVISDENPGEGTWDVPLSLSELSFRINDPEGELMSYSVSTSPDIGGGSGILKPDGVYSVPVGGLEYDEKYTWIVEVSDGKQTTVKQFSFYTESRPPFDPFDEGWQYRKEITIDHTMVNGDLTGFPVLVSSIDVDLRDKAQFDGDDILFMDGPGVATKLYHEIEYYDGSSGELVAWVNIPSLSNDVDTVLYMYYGYPWSNSQQFPEKVWDSDYIHVWHLGDSLSDSAGSDNGNNHGTSIVSGKIGKSRDFEMDENDFIDCGDMSQPADGSLTTITWECWVKPETQHTMLVSKYDSSGTDYSSYHIFFLQDGRLRIQAYSAWGVQTWGDTDNSYSEEGQWVYLTATFNLGGIKELGAYINGNKVAFTYKGQSANVMWNIPVTDDIGRVRTESTTHYADAVFDEVRWSKIVRNDAWIITSYNSMNNPSSFFIVGPEESAP